jgi:hypothetical protein
VITSRRAFLATLAGGVFVPKFEKWFRQGSGLLVPRPGLTMLDPRGEPWSVEIVAGQNAGAVLPARFDGTGSLTVDLPGGYRSTLQFIEPTYPPEYQARSLRVG